MHTKEQIGQFQKSVRQAIGEHDHHVQTESDGYDGLIVSIAALPLGRKNFTTDGFLMRHREEIGPDARSNGFHRVELRVYQGTYKVCRL